MLNPILYFTEKEIRQIAFSKDELNTESDKQYNKQYAESLVGKRITENNIITQIVRSGPFGLLTSPFSACYTAMRLFSL